MPGNERIQAADQIDPHTRADRDFHEATAHLYDSTLLPIFGVYYDLMIEPILDRLSRSTSGRHAIDIGCGTGGVTLGLAQRGFNVFAVDHSPAMIAFADRKLRDAGLDGQVEFAEGDIRTLPVAGDAFDVATCQGVLHHLDDLEPALAEMARVLKPGGLFYISEPCEGAAPSAIAWNRAAARLVGLKRRLRPSTRPSTVPAGTPVEVPDHDEGPIEADALVTLLKKHGFDVEVEYTNKFNRIESLPRVVRGPVIKNLSRPWRRRRGNIAYLTGRLR